ncbi:hypothetical protein FKW77_006718 [Venturia effusa]|uniref:Uncharacterized protein n=1 Tax=Venturia effusa TaxID=50376 RepID=A0A517LP65_9PEZI|nr:hypothetical protein FKW77_006718 [Venturia effusa]
MKLIWYLSLLATIPAAIGAAIAARSGFADESVHLVQCDLYRGSVRDGARDYVFYFPSDYEVVALGNPESSSTPNDPMPHDGMAYHIDWTSGTPEKPITASPGGRPFSLANLKRNGDGIGALVQATAALNDVDMHCYNEGIRLASPSPGNWTCQSQYSCTRSDRWFRSASLKMFKQTTTVSATGCDKEPWLATPSEAFAHYSTWATNKDEPGTTYNIGGGCSISFNVVGANPSDKYPYSPSDIQSFFTSFIVPHVTSTGITDSSRVCNVPGDDFPSGTRYTKSYSYPRQGYLNIRTSQQDNQDNFFDHEYHWAVTCPKKCDTNPVISIFTTIVTGLAGQPFIGPAAKGAAAFFTGAMATTNFAGGFC